MPYTDTLINIAQGYIGHREQPAHSNWGPQIQPFLATCRIYSPAPWCVAFVQHCLRQAGVGPVADRTAGALYLAGYAARHGWIAKTPRAGDVFVITRNGGHAGIVAGIPSAGMLRTIEGNFSDSVRANSRPQQGLVFIRVPNLVPRPRFLWLPRFQLVASVNQKPRIVVGWGRWAKVGPKIPMLAARYRQLRVERKLVKTRV